MSEAVLTCIGGAHNKEYRVAIVPTGSGFNVLARWGAVGLYLKSQLKTKNPVGLSEAAGIVENIIRAKVRRGYVLTPSADV